MRGINKVVISGVAGSHSNFGETPNGSPCGSFFIVSDRHSGGGSVVSVTAKINVYGDNLVRVCQARLAPGVYVIVEGELMNRGRGDHHTEIRAREVIFVEEDFDGSR